MVVTSPCIEVCKDVAFGNSLDETIFLETMQHKSMRVAIILSVTFFLPLCQYKHSAPYRDPNP